MAVAPRLIARRNWRGRVLPGDALFCPRNLCTPVRAAAGDYLMIVKEHPPPLHRDIVTLFASRTAPSLSATSLPVWDMRAARSEERGHGRHEQRRLRTSTALHGYRDEPGWGRY